MNYLIATAGSAPSVHSTQPWRFRASDRAIDMYADPCRETSGGPNGREMVISYGREMVISCGAALFGLRRDRGPVAEIPPIIERFPDPPGFSGIFGGCVLAMGDPSISPSSSSQPNSC